MVVDVSREEKSSRSLNQGHPKCLVATIAVTGQLAHEHVKEILIPQEGDADPVTEREGIAKLLVVRKSGDPMAEARGYFCPNWMMKSSTICRAKSSLN